VLRLRESCSICEVQPGRQACAHRLVGGSALVYDAPWPESHSLQATQLQSSLASSAGREPNRHGLLRQDRSSLEAATGKGLHVLSSHKDVVNSAHFSPDGGGCSRLVGCDASIWDASTGKEIRALKGHWGTSELRSSARAATE